MLNNNLHLSEDIYNANIKTASTRQGFGEALLDLGGKNKDVVVLTCDLKESTKVDKFAEKFPKRFFEVGVAEQNMAGIAAGLALSGKIPFMTSYATFSPGRNWEQIRVAICYTKANVKIVGGHAGFSADRLGASHQAFEDLAITRVLPNMVVIYPADYEQTKCAVKAAADYNGPVYLRVNRNDSPMFTTENTPFEIGKAQILKEGANVTIAVTGQLAYEALLAARELEFNHRIMAEVINVHTIKPLDEEIILKSAKKTGLVVSVEEHQVIGGLGSAIAELLSEKHPTPMHRLGMQNAFGESGDREKLLDKYGLTSKHIVNKITDLLNTKK